MALNETDNSIELGYVGDGLSLDENDGPLVGSDRYVLSAASVDALADETADFDRFLVDTGRLDGSDEALVAALDVDRPVISVSSDDAVTVSADALPHVDAYLSLSSGEVESLDPLDSVFEDHWRNLGMPADELLDVIFESVPVHLYLKDRDARHVRSSEYYNDPEDLIGKTDREIIDDAEFAERTYEDDQTVLSSGEPLIEQAEYNPNEADWSVTSKVPVYDGDEIVGLIGATLLITQRKEYEEQLERQKERLEEFASIISHDLRNPLTVAQGRVDLARERCPDDENLRVAVKHLRRMDELIDEVLTMTRQGRSVEETEAVELRSIAQQCWESVATDDATVTVEDSFRFRADHGRLRHVFENIFRNAVDHSDGNVSVSVGSLPGTFSGNAGTAEDRQSVGFYVADDGPGIPEGERDDVFDHGYTTSEDGTGLGLKIVRQVVEAHDWSVMVTESAEGGARFEIRGVELCE